MKNLFFVVLFFTACAVPKSKMRQEPLVFVGTYTQKLGHVNGQASGIYTCRMNPLNGGLTVIDSTTGIINPSFLCFSPNRQYMYAVAETGGSAIEREGKVVAYKITEGGQIQKSQKLNEQSSYGAAPCHISTDGTGKFVFVANYSTGNIMSYRVQADGSLSDTICMIRHKAEKQAWAHQILPTPDNRFVLAVDKGADKVFVYKLEPTGKLTPHRETKIRQGAGPRHFAFHPKGKFGFIINENGNTISAYKFNPKTAELTQTQEISTLPKDFKAQNTTAEIETHPNGKFVYGSNRGHNSIVAYRFEASTGQLSLIGHYHTEGAIPRNFIISPDGKFLLAANQNSDNVVAFHINTQTGVLTPTGANSRVWTPVCLQMY